MAGDNRRSDRCAAERGTKRILHRRVARSAVRALGDRQYGQLLEFAQHWAGQQGAGGENPLSRSRSRPAGVIRSLVHGGSIRGLELVFDDVAAGLLVRSIERWLQQVGVIELGDRVPGHDSQPVRLTAPSVALPRVMDRQLLVGGVDVPGVDHRVALVLLAEDLPDALRAAHRRKRNPAPIPRAIGKLRASAYSSA